MTEPSRNDASRKQEREALIAGDRAGTLDVDEQAELALFAGLLADPSTWAEPNAGLEDSVVHAVLESTPTALDSRRDVRRPRDGRARRGRIGLAIVGAAAAVVIVGGAVVIARREPHAAFTVRMSATALAPGARASADMYRNAAGFHVELVAHGLPKLPSGQYYQAWLKNDAGILVPIGSFSSSDGRVSLWSGVSPNDFPTLTVTIEAADNDQSSSGRRVLVGPVAPN